MTLLYFILAISILVVIHEYGHFWVARRCGVKVLRFSVGFGKPLWSFYDKQGTEYCIAPIPLGGYVKMLDEREAPVPEHLLNQAFNRKTPLQRIAIAVAGPLANFLFAIAAYWFLFVSGITGVVPTVGAVTAESPAAIAGVRVGDEIIAVADTSTNTWQEVSWQLLAYLGSTTDIPLQLRDEGGAERTVLIPVEQWLGQDDMPNPLLSLGMAPRAVPLPAKVGRVVENGAAARAGMQPDDTVLTVNNESIVDWYHWVDVVRASPEQALTIEVERAGQRETLVLIPQGRTLDDGQFIGYAGIEISLPSYPSEWLRTTHAGVVQAVQLALQKSYELTQFTLQSLWKMLAGDLSVKNLSGPISIAKVAGASASGGLESFIGFLALLSISLGVLNLLPIPVLDGGHIVFYAIELLRGKPLSESIQLLAVKIGMFLLFSLMLVAFYNDLSRL